MDSSDRKDSIKRKDRRILGTDMKIAIIGAISVIIAALIGVLGPSLFVEHNTTKLELQMGDTNLEHLNISISEIADSSIWGSPESYVTHSNRTRLDLQVGGIVDFYNFGRFSIVSSGDGLYLVERLYVKLHGYEDCRLRDEFVTLQAIGEITPYSLYISPEYSEYDIIPLDPPGNIGSWIYEGNTFDEFVVDFYCRPYTLFIISIELNARDLKNNNKIKLSSPLYKLIWIRNGNTGGCLDLENWYHPEDLAKPKTAKYMEKLTTLQYQLLIISMDEYNYHEYLSRIDRRQLMALLPQLKEIVSKRAANMVFLRNTKLIEDYLNQTSHD